MRWVRPALWPLALLLGIAAEIAGRPPLTALDAAVGFSLLGLGMLAAWRKAWSRAGMIMAGAGVAWFLGSIVGWAVFLHRGPLAQLLITYPATARWRPSWLHRAMVAAGYGYALAYPLAKSDEVTLAFALALAALAMQRYVTARGLDRRPRALALAATSLFAAALAAGAALGLAGVNSVRAMLAVYEIVIILIAAILSADLFWGSWTRAGVAALVIDLGDPAGGSVRDRLADTLADPSLAVGYWLPERNCYVDDGGRELAVQDPEQQRAVTHIDDSGGPLAVLIHDPAVLHDPGLIAGITAATRLAVANARLQAEVRTRLEEIDASRRRLVEASDDQRRRLERQLREGAEKHLSIVADLLAEAGLELSEALTDLDSARAELRELARGIHPATLVDAGLQAALHELAERSPVPAQVDVPALRWSPAVEATIYFSCSEALANVAKYAQASSVQLRVTEEAMKLRVDIIDDGVGGANGSSGSGLRGLADRVEALGGHFNVSSPPGWGTHITAEIPLGPL